MLRIAHSHVSYARALRNIRAVEYNASHSEEMKRVYHVFSLYVH